MSAGTPRVTASWIIAARYSFRRRMRSSPFFTARSISPVFWSRKSAMAVCSERGGNKTLKFENVCIVNPYLVIPLAFTSKYEIGRASCRERVYISVVAVSVKKNMEQDNRTDIGQKRNK